MSDEQKNDKNIEALFRDGLNIEVASRDTDLLEDGLLDSLLLVDLLMYLERDYKISVGLEDLELDNFRSISAVESFVNARLSQ
ncbi:MAG: hypothetical protein KJN72_01170 [Woeseia sp.]|nr:hypothetical protein [Woeseia sp.]